jgi:hypothetical protein
MTPGIRLDALHRPDAPARPYRDRRADRLDARAAAGTEHQGGAGAGRHRRQAAVVNGQAGRRAGIAVAAGDDEEPAVQGGGRVQRAGRRRGALTAGNGAVVGGHDRAAIAMGVDDDLAHLLGRPPQRAAAQDHPRGDPPCGPVQPLHPARRRRGRPAARRPSRPRTGARGRRAQQGGSGEERRRPRQRAAGPRWPGCVSRHSPPA